MFVPTFEVCPEFKNGTAKFVVVEAESVSFGQTAWEYLQLGSLVEGRLPDADEVVNLAEKAGIEASRTEINRLLERLLAEPIMLGGVQYHLAFGSGSTKDRRFMFSTSQNLSWLGQLFQTAENAFAYGGVFTSQASNLVRIPNAESGRLHVKIVEPGTLVAPDNIIISTELAKELETSIAQGRLLLLKDGVPVALAKGQFVEAVDDAVLADLKVDLIISSDCIKAGAFPENGPINDALFVLLNEPEDGMCMKLGYHVVMNLNDEELQPILEHGKQEMARINEAIDSGKILPLVGEELMPESKTLLGALAKTGYPDVLRHPCVVHDLERALGRRQIQTCLTAGIRVPAYDLVFDTISTVGWDETIRVASNWVPEGYFLGGPRKGSAVVGRFPVLGRESLRSVRYMHHAARVLADRLGIDRIQAELLIGRLEKPGVIILNKADAAASASDGDYDLVFALSGTAFDALWKHRKAEIATEQPTPSKQKTRLATPYSARHATAIRIAGSSLGLVDNARTKLRVTGWLDEYRASMATHQNCADAIKYDIPGLADRIDQLLATATDIEPPVWLGLTKSGDVGQALVDPDLHEADQVGKLWNTLVPMTRRVNESALGRSHFKPLFNWSHDLELGRTAAAMVSSYNASVRHIIETVGEEDDRNEALLKLFQGLRAWAASLSEADRWEIFGHAGAISHNGSDKTEQGQLIRASFVFRVFPQETVKLFAKLGGGMNVEGEVVMPEAPMPKVPDQVTPAKVYIGAAGWAQRIKDKEITFQQAVASRNALIGRVGTLVEVGSRIGVNLDETVTLFVRRSQGQPGERVLISPLSGNPWALALTVIGVAPVQAAPAVIVPLPTRAPDPQKPARKLGLVGILDRNRTIEEVLQLIQARQALVVNGVLYGPDLQELASLRPTNISVAQVERECPDLAALSFKATGRSLNAVL